MHNESKISLIMPCHNEEKGLKEIFKKIPDFIDEVIIIDNNSTDSTSAIAKKYGVKVIFLEKLGYGLAYQTGLSEAAGDVIVMIDADDTYPINEIEKLVAAVAEGNYDFLTGCRFPLTNKEAMPFYKQLSNRFMSWLIRKLFHISLKDSQSGMFVFKRSLLPKIMPVSPGMGFSQNLKIKAWMDRTIKTGEIHINYTSRVGRVKYRTIKDSVTTIIDAVRLLCSKKNRHS